MAERRLRWGLLALAASAAGVGLPALLAPQRFFDDFPFVAHWVDRLGGYNAHLTTDVGGLYLGFAALFAMAALRPGRDLVVAACAAWTLPACAHLVFHVTHLDGFPAADAVAQTVSLAALAVAPVLIALAGRRSAPAAGTPAPRRQPFAPGNGCEEVPGQ